jgi:hypothetical protein
MAIVLGQLAVPVFLVSSLQCAALLTIQAAVHSWRSELCVSAAFTWPFNAVLFSLENLLFLLFPMRLFASPGDVQAMGRHILRWLAQLIALLSITTLAGLISAGVYMISNNSDVAAALAAWLTLAAGALALVPLLSFAFRAFDVSRDTPP